MTFRWKYRILVAWILFSASVQQVATVNETAQIPEVNVTQPEIETTVAPEPTKSYTEYTWIASDVLYDSEGVVLQASVLDEYDGTYLVTQCAYRCLLNAQCRAYNFYHSHHVCQLLAEDHTLPENSFREEPDGEYYTRNAFLIDQVRDDN